MAAKRLRNDSDDQDDDQRQNKRIIRPVPSFSTVIREALAAKSMQNFFFTFEPLLRKVVQEEVERGLVQNAGYLQRINRLQLEAPEQAIMKLEFVGTLSLPIYTGSKIEDVEGNSLQVRIISSNDRTPLPSSLKLEVVVLDGDFLKGDKEDWTTADEFDSKILKERVGKRPLITGDVILTMRDRVASIPDLSLTDNSSWIRSRNFRIGVRVAPGSYSGARIKEAVTVPFVVKDHRGELYKKHYPPVLGDDVWRLEKIGKDGAFHKKLSENKIQTVQDFLKLCTINQDHLRQILGPGMSDRMWEVTLGHARTCELGDKTYVLRAQQCAIFLNPICEVVRVVFGTMTCTLADLNKSQKAHVQGLVQEAYANWDSLEESTGAGGLPNQVTTMVQTSNAMGQVPWLEDEQENASFGYSLMGLEFEWSSLP